MFTILPISYILVSVNVLGDMSILGVRVHVVDKEAALDCIEDFIRSGQPHMVVTADSSAVVLAQDDEELRRIINSADLVTPDSIGILWAARRFGTPLPERVSGVDIVEFLCEKAACSGYRIYLLGAAPGVADVAADRLRERFPGLHIAGTHHGYLTPEESESVAVRVKEANPDILFVAMGIPLQEKWIRRHLEQIGVPVAMGVGGTFDVLAGRTRRAPKWMQQCGLEWLYRLARNPRKIRKCATLPVFAYLTLRAGRGPSIDERSEEP